ncbi:hypothetical protein [Candidatus Palauibacter sp.]|uniref:hypothetical protein n=1 Tax=Candidatus Palauibacter sp. TaxID=3101350 RepID=UPI003B024DAE
MDLVLELPRCARPCAFEIKCGLVPRVGRGFRSALEDIRPERAFVVYGGDEQYPLWPGVDAIGLRSAAELLRDVGSGSVREP